MAALLAPFRQCAEFLNVKVVQNELAPGMEAAFKFVENLSEDDLKDKASIHWIQEDFFNNEKATRTCKSNDPAVMACLSIVSCEHRSLLFFRWLTCFDQENHLTDLKYHEEFFWHADSC